MKRRDTYIKGFSLVELAAVIAIAGLVLAAVGQGLRVHLENQKVNGTFDKAEKLATAIDEFSRRGSTRYPCPADPTLPETDAQFGIEMLNCNDDGVLPRDTCTRAGNTGVCKWTSRPIPGLGNAVVITGAMPHRRIEPVAGGGTTSVPIADGVAYDDMIDAWGGRMMYAVTGALTNSSSYNVMVGGVAVETETGESLVEPAASAHYLVWSTGPNGMGGYSMEGRQIAPCITGAGAMVDSENCDGGAVTGATFVSGLISEAGGATYYDDTLKYVSAPLLSLWDIDSTTAGGGDKVYIYNTNPGNVGVGFHPGADNDGDGNPDQPLRTFELYDDPSIDTDAKFRITKDGAQMWVDDVCRYDDPDLIDSSYCLSPRFFGYQKTCDSDPNNFVAATGIQDQGLECNSIPWATTTIVDGVSCDPGDYAWGFASDGRLLCQTPP